MAIVVSAALLTFVVVRAHQDPAIDFGRPTTAGRLVDLVRQKDFLTGSEAPSGVRTLSKAPSRTVAYGRITVQEVGAATVALALVGTVVVFRRRHRGDTLFLGLVMVANVVGAVFVAGLEHDTGITSGMVVGGFLIDLVLVIGVLVAVGTTALGDAAVAWAGARPRGSRLGALAPGVLRGTVAFVAAAAVLRPVARRARALRNASRAGARRPLRAAGALRAGAERRLVDVRLGVRPADPLPPDRVRRTARRVDPQRHGGEARVVPRHADPRGPVDRPTPGLPYDQYVAQFLANAVRSGPARLHRHVGDRPRPRLGPSASTGSWPS